MRITETMVLFWGNRDIYSNWHPSLFVIDDVQYANVEQYMMAEKARCFGDADTEQAILRTTNPKDIKALGRAVRNYVDERWVAVRPEVVTRACIAKFSQNEALRRQLLATGDKLIVEASPVDAIWGIGLAENDPRALDPQQWRGQNLLGIALMKAREVIREAEKAFETPQLF